MPTQNITVSIKTAFQGQHWLPIRLVNETRT